jgi:hypothetical protein
MQALELCYVLESNYPRVAAALIHERRQNIFLQHGCPATGGGRFRDTSDNYPRPALRVGLCVDRQHVALGTSADERAAGTSDDSVDSYPLLAHLADAYFRKQAAAPRTDLHVALQPEAHFQRAERHPPLHRLPHSLGAFCSPGPRCCFCTSDRNNAGEGDIFCSLA